jgi:hypothetical protein
MILDPFGNVIDPDDYDDLFTSEEIDDLLREAEDLFDKTGASKLCCDCGAHKVYGINSNLHSDWCSLKSKKK